MEIQSDFRELLELFNAHKVEYIIVGGYALAFHGAPRYTGDIDIFVKPSTENAQYILAALDDFGFSSLNLKIGDFKRKDKVVQLGVPPVRVDIMTSISGVSWEDALVGSVKGNYADIFVKYIGLNEFVINKRAVGRKKDLSDLEALAKD
jgi:predicted nucleotidyltransferase